MALADTQIRASRQRLFENDHKFLTTMKRKLPAWDEMDHGRQKFLSKRHAAHRRSRKAWASAVIAIGCVVAPVRAGNIIWNNNGKDFLWGTPANWSSNALPGPLDNAVFS